MIDRLYSAQANTSISVTINALYYLFYQTFKFTYS